MKKTSIVEHFEVEFLKTLTYEEINGLINQLNDKIKILSNQPKQSMESVSVDIFGRVIKLPMDNYLVSLEKGYGEIVKLITKYQDGRTLLEPINCSNYGVTSDEFLQEFYEKEVNIMIKRREEKESRLEDGNQSIGMNSLMDNTTGSLSQPIGSHKKYCPQLTGIDGVALGQSALHDVDCNCGADVCISNFNKEK